MPTTVEERLRLARPNAGGPTLDATAVARKRALAALPVRSNRRRILAVAVTFAVAAAVVLAVELRDGTGVASAAQVRAAVSQTLASASNLSGTLVIDDPDRGEQRWSFALNSAGDLRLRGLDTSDDLAYDGRTDTLESSNGRLFRTITDYEPGPSPLSVDWMLEREVGSVITALAADGDAQVQEIQYEGRPAWLLTIHADLRGGPGTAERDIVVDRSLGLPVHDVLKNAGTVLGEWRLENLAVDTDLPPDTFALQPRPGQETTSESLNNRRVDPKAIEGIAGYAPLVPTWLPDGYRLDRATLTPTFTAAGDLAGDNVATFFYRRGLEQLTVTMRPPATEVRSALPAIGRFCTTRSIDAMVCADTAQTLSTHDVTLESGALAGRTAKVTIDIATPPTLKVEAPTLDVQVSGDADEAELTHIAESFAR